MWDHGTVVLVGRGSALIVASAAVAVAVVSVVVLGKRADAQRESPIATSRALAEALPEARIAVVRALRAGRGSGRRGVLSAHTGAVRGLAFSPDNKTLAGAGYHVPLWNAATGKRIGRLRDDDAFRECLRARNRSCDDGESSVAFSPDNKTLASAGGMGTVRLWNAVTRKPIALLTGHRGAIYAVAFSPDNQTLASASIDNTVRLWNAATRKPIGRLAHHGDVNAVAFSPDNKTLASAGYDHTVRLWDIVVWRNITELRTTICNVRGSGLTRSEWKRYAPNIKYQPSCP